MEGSSVSRRPKVYRLDELDPGAFFETYPENGVTYFGTVAEGEAEIPGYIDVLFERGRLRVRVSMPGNTLVTLVPEDDGA